jgi:hypothetical protein
LEAKLGKRLSFSSISLLVFISFSVSALRGQTPPPRKEPLFVYLNARITDHVNIEMSEDRLRRLLPEIE